MAAKPFILDPSGLLARVPELEEIAEEDRRVLAAIQSGEPHAVFAALRSGRLFGRIRKHAATARELLANRRLFLVPPRGKLWLSTYNGIGATFYGENEPDFVDGSYIATHFFVLFFVPLFPLGQYLVRNATAQDGGQGYFVLGRVPFRVFLQLWSRLLTLLVFVGLVATLLSLFRSAKHNDFYVVNELGVPIEAELCGRVLKVASGTVEKADLPTGTHDITIYGPQRRTIETGQVQIRPGQQIIAWNVLGAAALVHRKIEYRSSSGPQPQQAAPTIHCGERVITYRKVDVAWSAPPSSIRTRGSGETRTHLGVAEPGARLCLRYLAQQSRDDAAAAIAVGRARLLHYALPDFENDLHVLLAQPNPTAARKLAAEGRAAHPRSVLHHRLYQMAMAESDELPAVRAEYASPPPGLDAADAAYLSARILPLGEPRRRRAKELASRFSDHGLSLAWAASVLCDAADFESAAPIYDRLRRVDPPRFRRDIELAATALLATGRGGAALEAIAAEFDGDGEPIADGRQTKLALAILYARVAERVPAAKVDTLINRLTGDDPSGLRALSRMWAGQRPPPGYTKLPEGLVTVWRLQERAIKSADNAMLIKDDALDEISLEIGLLVYAEAVRRNDPNLEKKTTELLRVATRRVLARVTRYIRDGQDSEQLDLSSRAVLRFVRSRDENLPAAERAALLAEAKRLAALPGPFTRALVAWPAAEKSDVPKLEKSPEKSP
jgi:hypothetical protein